MKNVKVSLFFLLCISMCLSAFGEVFNGPTTLSWKVYDSLAVNGPANFKLVKAKTLQVNGPLQFHNLDVAGKAEVDGSMKGDKGKFGQLFVTGPMDVDHVICGELSVKGPVKATYLDVQNHAEIVGPLEVQHGKFKSLAVNADKIILEAVTIETIVVNKGNNNQTLVLRGQTIVNGDIVFESGNGIVQIESSDVRTNGSVKGATVKKSP